MRIVTYSLYVDPPKRHTDYHEQLIYSVKSLRRYNQSVPVIAFLYGEHSATFKARLAEHGVEVHPMGVYEDAIRRFFPGPFRALTTYPVLHKWLNFSTLEDLTLSQILQSDCDTIFFDDVEILFRTYTEKDFYAREEPASRASHYGYDPHYLDEDALSRVVESEGAIAIDPCNIGVCILNHGLWREIARRTDTFLSYAFRFAAGIARDPHRRDLLWPQMANAVAHDLMQTGEVAALPYPSSNLWILDQMALWLTLGHIPNLTCGFLSPDHVVQGTYEPGFGHAKVVHHYFGTDKVAFRSEVSRSFGW